MEKHHINKQEAVRQVDEIYALIKGNLHIVLSSTYMIAIGCAIACIPLLELFFNQIVDPTLIRIFSFQAPYIIFALRTIFYWALFMLIRYVVRTKQEIEPNAFVKKLCDVGRLFPIIPVSTAAALALIGYSDIITPIVLILIGTFFVILGQFAPPILSIVAWANIIAGLIGIYISSYGINHLWIYLLVYQGCTFIIMGIVLHYLQQHDK